MFTPSSRYFPLPDRVFAAPDGTRTVYKARRFLPLPARVPGAGLVTVQAGDRLDLVAARALGQPQLYWRIADANGAMDPRLLVAVPGRKLRVPVPQVEEALPPLEG